MKKSAIAAAGTGVAATGAGAAAAQEGDETDTGGGDSQKALMFSQSVNPFSEFVITSPVLEWVPNVEEVRDNVWSDYNTRMIRYLGTGQRATFFQAQDAQVPNFNQEAGYVVDAEGDTADDGTPQPEVYRLEPESTFFDPNGWLQTVNFSAVGEDEEDDFLDDEDWWLSDEEETGTATDSA
ncbi:hypothetical protein ACFQL4_14790 [Halosimplex aquaticum]